jgi:dipeptidyl aminopeptidase/acylaminoacyl peptidase
VPVQPSEAAPANLFGDGRLAITAFAESVEVMAAVGSTAGHAGELFVQRRTAGSAARRLTDSNPWLNGVAMGEQTVEVVPARDGLPIEGVLIKPVGYRKELRYPLVIVVHGGPEAHFSDGWLSTYNNWGQLLAARGIVTWYPNYRASTGYGVEFCKLDHGDPMGHEFEDHLDAIDHFATRGLIDPARVGIGGGSYGGYAAAWAATRHSDRFAAAVSFVPFVHLPTKWMTTDIPWEFYLVHYQEKWPWQQPGFLADRSPLTWAEHCRTPLLLAGGTADPRVHPSQPFMLFRAVKSATTTPVRYVQYPGEGHGNRSNVYQYDYALRAVQWFTWYLQGDGDRRRASPPPFEIGYPLK